jgi:hypothetical protein
MVPNVSAALTGLTKKTVCKLVTKSFTDYEDTSTFTDVTLNLFLGPMPPQAVSKKPEGQRAWRWYRLLTKKSDYALKIDDVVVIGTHKYRIITVQPYENYGFYRRYDAVQDYDGVTL